MKQIFNVLAFTSAVLIASSIAAGPSFVFTTLAGPREPGAGASDGVGSLARFNGPSGVATDANGNIYVADQWNHTIRKITAAGAVTTLAGLAGKSGSADGTDSAARFYDPSAVATDGNGTVYVADTLNNTIRKITPTGQVSTLAGLAGTSGSTDGNATTARFFNPSGLACDAAGNVYVADQNNHTIRKITGAGEVSTLAGMAGTIGSADGIGSSARFRYPEAVAVDGSGNVYVADNGNFTLRKITPQGDVSTLAGLARTPGTADGLGSVARFFGLRGVAVDKDGSLYVSDPDALRHVTPAGYVSTYAGGIAGSVDGTLAASRFEEPLGVAIDASGNLFVADQFNHTIRKISAAGMVSTLAGLTPNILALSGTSDGSGSEARFSPATGVTIDANGNAYVADYNSHVIRRISAAGAVSTIAGLAQNAGTSDGSGNGARFKNPYSVASDGAGNIFVADTGNHAIRQIDSSGTVTTIAGLAGSSGNNDGTGSAARFNLPYGIASDHHGNLYVADSGNRLIRKIAPGGVVTTLAGSFRYPMALTLDGNDNLFVSDNVADVISKITAAGEQSTLAGSFLKPGYANGTGSAALFDSPNGVATDAAGNVFVADSKNQVLRMITPAGSVTTIAGGSPWEYGSTDGPASTARFYYPTGLAFDGVGNLYVIDRTIRLGRSPLPDVAVIDVPRGLRAVMRRLDTSPQTATSWEWSVVRRPVDSVAVLSAANVRNPTFTPDVDGLFTFRLIAGTPTGASVTTVDLVAGPLPHGDSNGDGAVTVADVFHLLSSLFAGGSAPVGNVDVNGDGSVTGSDVFYLINFLFANGPAPL